MEERLRRQLSFIKEADKEKEIVRQTYLADGTRKEDDAEHAWHMALMAVLLSEYASEPIDVLHTVTMILIHDLVEIGAGDTYAYDEAANVGKKEREQAAAEELFAMLPEDQREEMLSLFEEFDENHTPEARFANSLDKIQPLLLNDASGGISWKEHGVCASQVLNRNKETGKGSEILWNYGKKLIKKNKENGNLYSELYLAGGCFWGTQRYFDSLYGVISTEVGYANGSTENPTYEDVKYEQTGHAETVHVVYDASLLSLSDLLLAYYRMIDPVSVNRQGEDVGVQYRTGIYYTDPDDGKVIADSLNKLQEQYDRPIAVEALPLVNFYPAEESHQKYLEKHPEGYCHVSKALLEEAAKFNRPDE